MEPRRWHAENIYWAVNRAHDLVGLIRAHGLVIRAHEFFIGAHELLNPRARIINPWQHVTLDNIRTEY